ncbi:hypothetical protein [Streptomyces sp. NBC_00304]|uniref:hypothetical protein n=1 Tax=Streptomyces sp. NBC_00304 TaxID=2975706 RepID=UPI002E28A7C5|nr:hypothetical protein [Streptomyces sp. NBC_00304]
MTANSVRSAGIALDQNDSVTGFIDVTGFTDVAGHVYEDRLVRDTVEWPERPAPAASPDRGPPRHGRRHRTKGSIQGWLDTW